MRGSGNAAAVEEGSALLERMALLVGALHDGVLGPVKHLIHIGIGGSALGPAMAVDALTRDGAKVDVHVVSNIDGLALEAAFAACDPATTMVAVASKTFTTIETMTNAESALKWLGDNGVDDPGGRVVALTASPEKAVEWGVDETRILPFPETVGGRYSLWSSIGFPVAMAMGMDDFRDMLAGARAMDEHFDSEDGRDNLALRAAFADQYYTRLRGCQTRAVFAYDERLSLLPDYLQQLEMESNGKRVTRCGRSRVAARPRRSHGAGWAPMRNMRCSSCCIRARIWCRWISSPASHPATCWIPAHHRILLTNCFAQGAALMAGGNMSADGRDPARAFPGDRPSATILATIWMPPRLGALIAFHEHRTFANAVLMGINPFDQFGVELGKKMAKDIESGAADFDAGTKALLAAAGLSAGLTARC